jgi:two-component system, OmpR family, response regulator QseB
MRVLIVEDDPMIGSSLVRGLTDEGYAVDWVRDGVAAEGVLKDRLAEFQLVLLDWGLPHKSGIEVLRALRAGGNNIPVLILTARDALADRVEGLDRGADDFLVKPFELAELKARMRALLRRHAGRVEPQLRTAKLLLDPASRSVTREGRQIQLTAREYALLLALMQRPGTLFSRTQLEERIYGWSNPIESNAVEFLLHSLRRKIGTDQIENLRGLGWRVPGDR